MMIPSKFIISVDEDVFSYYEKYRGKKTYNILIGYVILG